MTASTPETEATPTQTMSARSWLVVTLGLILLGLALNFLLVWRMDIFGILRDPAGRQIRTSRHERKAKYLLNYRYVPANFNALVIGASSSLNWDLPKLAPGYRFYNESLLGADGVEQRKIVEKALETGHIKLAIVGISRGLTDRHDLQDGLDDVNPHEALGSFYAYVMIVDRLLHPHTSYGPDGSWQITGSALVEPDPNVRYPRHKIDSQAFNDYRTVTQELIDHGAKVVYVMSPHYKLVVSGAKPVLDDYAHDVLSQMPPGPFLNLNADEYAWLYNNPAYFIDEDHLSPAGAEMVTKLVHDKLEAILKN